MTPSLTFSVIVPVHNESDDIGPTCDALLRLEPPPEILFVDDASTDDTIAVIEQYLRRSSMRVLRQPVNRGQGAARNAAVRVATGDVLVFVDADVLVPPDLLQRLAPHYERGADYVEVESEVAHTATAYARFVDAQHKTRFGGDAPVGWSQAFSCRREVALQSGLFPEAFPAVGEDGEFVRRLEKISPRRIVDRSIVARHVVPDTLRGFWRQWHGRGRAVPLFRHQTQHVGWVPLVIERLGGAAWSAVRILTVIPTVREASAYARRSARRWADLLPFIGLTILQTVAHRYGEWKGLVRLARSTNHAG